MSRTEPFPLFYSLDRFIDYEACISAGSVEICRASFILDVVGERTNSTVKRAVEGKLDTCGSVSLSHSSHLQDVKDCRKHAYGIKTLQQGVTPTICYDWLKYFLNTIVSHSIVFCKRHKF